MIRIRRAARADAAAIGRVHVETWQATYAGLLPDAMLVAIAEGHVRKLQALVDAVLAEGLPPEQRLRTLIRRIVEEYADAVRQGQFPVVRGLALSRDDLVRRAVVMALMCQGRLEFESIELAHLIRMPEYFRPELEEMAELEQLGLVTVTPEAVQVTPTGWYFVRAVAMVFDRHLRADQARERFSRII